MICRSLYHEWLWVQNVLDHVVQKEMTVMVLLQEERVLFHYNGHGVPKPTTNGEIWVFNKVRTRQLAS